MSEPYIVIDENRDINVPEELRGRIVQFDHNVETFKFQCPRYWDGRDLSTMKIFVNYVIDPKKGTCSAYLVKELNVNEADDNMTFDWVVTQDATTKDGELIIFVCAQLTDELGNLQHHWSSNFNKDFKLAKSYKCLQGIVDNYPNIIGQILADIDKLKENGGSVTFTYNEATGDVTFGNETVIAAPEGIEAHTEVTSINGRGLQDTVAREKISELSEEIADLTGGSLVEPKEDDIPKVFFSEAIPQTKDDVVTKFRYISKTKDVSGYAEFKAQGNSSMSYPKKNVTVKMYADEALEEKLKVDFKGWGEQRKHVYKANWIDLSHARNVVSARLWADIVKSRAEYLTLPELLRTSPNQGAVDGFPIKVYSQGIYQGRYTLNIPKDAWMANMDDSLETHCILCGENYTSGCFRATANINGSDWTDEIHDTVPTAIKTRWNEVIAFVMNSTDEEFKANLGNYFFVDSLIDYFIFGMVSCGLDAFGKNQLYFTYDGIKWIASMYDMDSTWGLYWNGSKFVSASYSREEYEDFVSTSSSGDGNLLYIRLASLFYEEIQARYDELKQGALSIPNVINHFERFTDIASLDLVKEDYANTTGSGKFTGIPSRTTNNIQQIRQYVVDRYVYCDEYFASLGENGGEVEPDNPQVALTSISATYTGGDVTVGTALNSLTGITVIGTYSDGSTANITGYTLSGTIAEGANTITVSYGEKTTAITVTGIVSGGDTPDIENNIDYTHNPLAGVNWLSGNAIDKATGDIVAKASHYVTEPFTLQDCVYEFNRGTGNTYMNIAVYDENGDCIFVGESSSATKFTLYAKSEYTYRVQVYSASGTYGNVTASALNRSSNAVYSELNLADLEWVTSNKVAEAKLTSEQATLINTNVDQCDNVIIGLNGQFSSMTASAMLIETPMIFDIGVWSSNYYLYAPYFATGEEAISYFTENGNVLKFNERYQ